MEKKLVFLLLIILYSCSNELDKIKNSNDLMFLGNYVKKFTSKCIDSNHPDLLKKFHYNKTDSTLVFYTGISKSNFKEKWTIPLKEINISLDKKNKSMLWNELIISGNSNVIKYENINSNNNGKTNHFVIYEYNWCDKLDQKKFEIALKRMIVISKK